MKSLAVNHDFDDKQGDQINWEDHIGLCHKAAGIMCSMTEKLRPHYMDIVETLKGKLWEITQPKEDGGYDYTVSRFSTYAMVGLLRFHREIKQLYLPTVVGISASEQRATTHFVPDTVWKAISDKSVDEPSRLCDLKEILGDVFSCLSEKQVEFFEAWMPTGMNNIEACKEIGMSRGYAKYSRGKARDHVEWLKKNDIELYNQYIDAIGGVPA